MRRRCSLAAVMAVLLVATAVHAADFVWIEGEKPSSSNCDRIELKHYEGHPYLSEGKWLRASIPAADAARAVPTDGILLGYDFDAPSAGNYEVWDRIGYEFVRSPFSWRVDQGPWHAVQPTDLTTDLMVFNDWNEIAWFACGRVDLAAGKHRLEVRLQRWSKEANGKKEEQNILYCSDALCLSKESFRPNGKFKPGADYRDERDRKAADHVFRLPAESPAGERVELSLAGLWQMARWDEVTVKEEERTQPITTVPEAEKLYWYGIEVPGDRNQKRPDFAYCHRYVYRTRVEVPAELKGRSFSLHFRATSLIVSVLVNGRFCGANATPMAAWDCDVTSALRPGQVNEVLVAVKDGYYGVTTPRDLFNLPMSFFNFQGASNRFDFPIWNYLMNGIVEPATLVAGGGVYTSDVFALPSVAKKQLGLEITLKNATGADATVRMANACVPLGGGSAEKTFAAQEVTVPAGAEKVVRLSEDWTNPKLWWPDDPRQYHVVTTLSLNGRVIDTCRTKFGFREWRWDHAQFTLNGVPFHGHADLASADTPAETVALWRKHGQNMMRFWGVAWMGMNQGDALDYLDRSGVVVRRSGLFDGEGANYRLGESVKVDGKDVVRAYRALFDHWAAQVKAQVRAERNHPCVMIWSIENEITYINSRNLGQQSYVEPAVRDVARQVMALDPTRPVMTDGGHALMDHSLPVIGAHYAETDMRDYPDEAYTGAKLFHEVSGIWTWDPTKPGFMGESLYTAGNPPSYYAGLQGESAFLGRGESARGEALLVKMVSEGYRWLGIGAAHFWMTDTTDSVYNSWQPVAVLCRQWDWTFAGGHPVERNLRVFNDTRSADPIEVTWQFQLGDRVVEQETKSFSVAPGMSELYDVTLHPPAVEKGRHKGQLVLSARRGGKEVFHDVKPLVVINPDEASRPRVSKGDLVVIDPTGHVKARLRARGIDFTEVAGVEAVPAGARVVLVGDRAVSPRQATSPRWLELAAGGTRVVVLEQDNPLHFQALPADLEPTDYVGRVAFSENLEHPVFAGLGQEDFFTWSKDHVVYRNVYRKASRGARSLVQCEPELTCSALAECQVNDGLMLLCQLVVGEKLAYDPVAQRLFDNALDYAADYHVVRKRTAVVADEVSPWRALMANLGLKFDPVGNPAAALAAGRYDILVVQATPANLKGLAEKRDQVRAFAERGGYLMLCGLTPEGLADFNKLAGVEHVIRPFEMERVTLATPNDPLMAGLTARDIVMESGQQITQWTGDRFVAGDIFSYVVDLEDVAPFCKVPGPEYFKNPGAAPGDDKWPRNMVNGFTFADSWKYCFTIAYGKGEPLTWTMDLPRAEELVELSLQPTPIFNRIDKVKLTFDGGESVTLTLGKAPGRQDLPVPPHRVRKLTIELVPAESGKAPLVGVDNLWLRVARPADFGRRVRPMLNIGALVRYPMGTGGIVLNNVLIRDRESVPVNLQKKQAIVGTILRNLGATFSGGQVLTAANMKLEPVPFNEQANAYLTKGHGTFGDVDLSTLPVGEQKFAGVTYRLNDFRTSPVPAGVMIRSPGMEKLPAEATVKVGRKADVLFFLQGYVQAREWKTNDPNALPPVVFKYVVRYADGRVEEVPVRLTLGVGPYDSDSAANLKNAEVAWSGRSPAPHNRPLVVYQLPWTNPRPEVEIQAITLKRDEKEGEGWGAPVWIGLTAGAAVR